MSRLLRVTGTALVFAAACSGSPRPRAEERTASAAAGTEPVAGVGCPSVASDERPPEDRSRDAARKPCEILAFFAIEPGMQVAELMAGRGYYTEILARAVGEGGTLYAQNNQYVLDRFADEPLTERLDDPKLSNVVRLDRELGNLGLPQGELDAVVMVLFYHDTYWMEVDRAALNRAVYAALKPGGVYGIVDHHAQTGSGARDVKSLHRVERALVVESILEAGFALDGESDVLRHPGDDRTTNVFSEAIRGETDRFVLRFRKPAR